MKIPKFEAPTEWLKPTEFPDLRHVDEIAIDLETKDPDLIKKGSGSVIGNGDVLTRTRWRHDDPGDRSIRFVGGEPGKSITGEGGAGALFGAP